MPAGARPLSNVPPPIAIAAGLHGAFLLARGRPWGLLLFETSPAGAARSFIAMLFCLPAYLGLRLLDWTDGAAPDDPLRALVVDLIGFAVAWLGYAALSFSLAEALGRAHHWPRFLCAWNWSNVVQYTAMVLLVAPGALLGLPQPIPQALGLIALGYALWVEWYVTRLALELPAMGAAALVVVDLAIGLMIGGLIARLGAG